MAYTGSNQFLRSQGAFLRLSTIRGVSNQNAGKKDGGVSTSSAQSSHGQQRSSNFHVQARQNINRKANLMAIPASVQGFQGREHEFSPSRAREILAQAIEYGSQSETEKRDSVLQGVQGEIKTDVTDNTQSQTSAGELHQDNQKPSDEHLGKYDCQSNVSLYSVMQSNVPEPFRPLGRNPTHLNMPGGGVKLQDKYMSGKWMGTYTNNREYSTFTSNMDFTADIPCPQGVQGEDCSNFRVWLENCRKYGFEDCKHQLEGIRSGRKTLYQVFAEQDDLIREIAEHHNRQQTKDTVMEGVQDVAGVPAHDVSSMQGLQGEIPQLSVESLASMSDPCPQGVQGNDCVNFKVWLQNCVHYGLGDCENQLRNLRSGRKTLQQIFQEQDQLIHDIALQYSTGSAPSGGSRVNPEVSGNLGSSPPDPKNPQQLSQKDKLKRAVKEYGSTVVVFHVCISLVSLGGFYLAVSSGIDMVAILAKMGVGQSILESKLATGTSTFVVAYAVHKVFAPVRIGITLTSTPLIVRYLRRIGFLKPPKVKTQ